MKLRLFWLFVTMLFLTTLTGLGVSASSTHSTSSDAPKLLRRCENNYEDEEIAAMRADGEDDYEPDDCPLLAHMLTGPMLLNFCQAGDEDWIKFKAKPDLLYQIRAEPIWNYPTEPKLELYVDGVLVVQNEHYFKNNAEVWWWNSSSDRIIYARIVELAGRHDCGNSAYTLTLNSFNDNPYPQTTLVTSTPALTPTLTVMPTVTVTAAITATAVK